MEKLGKNIAKYCFLVFIFLFSIANIFFTVKQQNGGNYVADYKFGITPIHLFLCIFLFFLFYLLNKKDYFGIKEKRYLIIFLLVVTIIGFYWIFSNPRTLISYDDSRNCFESAKTILSGDYSPLGYRSYLNTYPNNITLTTYFMLIIKLFGEANAITIINFVNLAFVIIGYVYIYKITSILFNSRKTNLNVVSLMFLSSQFIFFSYYVYGNVISISLSFVSIYHLLKYINNNNKLSFILSFVSISLSIGIKNNTMIVLVAEIIYLVIYTIIRKRLLYIVLLLLMVLGTFVCTSGVIMYWQNKTNYNYNNKLPRICWIAYGFNYDQRHPGSFFDSLERFHSENGYVVEYTTEKAKDFIKGTFSDFEQKPSLIPIFYGQKMLLAWANPEYGVFTYDHLLIDSNVPLLNRDIIYGNIHELLWNVWDVTLTAISIGLIIYIYKRRKEIRLLELILAVVVIGGFIFHIFWELKSIYMYHYYLCLLPYAAHGLMILFNKK